MVFKLEKYEEDYFKMLAFRLYIVKWNDESSILCIRDDGENEEAKKILQIASKYGSEGNYVSGYIRFRLRIFIRDNAAIFINKDFAYYIYELIWKYRKLYQNNDKE